MSTDRESLERYLNLSAGVARLCRDAPAIVAAEGEHRGLKIIIGRLHQLEDDGERLRDQHLEAVVELEYAEGHSCHRPQFPCAVCDAVEYVERRLNGR